MQSFILYTKKFELSFNDQSVSQTDVTALLEELSKEYNILDSNPAINISGNIQYVTFKLSKKEDRKKIGF